MAEETDPHVALDAATLDVLLEHWDSPDRPEGWNSGDEHHLASRLILALRANLEASEEQVIAWATDYRRADSGRAAAERMLAQAESDRGSFSSEDPEVQAALVARRWRVLALNGRMPTWAEDAQYVGGYREGRAAAEDRAEPSDGH